MPRSFVSCWRLVAVVIILFVWVFQPTRMGGLSDVQSDFDEMRARAHLEFMLGDQSPHPVDSDANDAVRDRLLALIKGLGFTPIQRDQFHCNDYWDGSAVCARVQNIAFWATSPGDNAVLVMAHYDSVAAGPGVGDDGVGVAAALEIARIVSNEAHKRPILILLTDGEEDGLVGAAAFAKSDPLAENLTAVVNLEARTASGSAAVLRTALPNANEVAALRIGSNGPHGFIPQANSIDTDLSDVIPGDMDFSMFLPLGIDGLNYVLLGSHRRYHTPLDNLENYAPNSAKILGASALAGTRAFANLENTTPRDKEGTSVFSNMGPSFLLAIPVKIALSITVGGLLASCVAFAFAGGGQPMRSAVVPLIAALAGGGTAVGVTELISLVRVEEAYASVTPIALRGLQAMAALASTSFVLAIFRVNNITRISVASWSWLSIMILALFFKFPGASTLIIPGAVLMLAACVFSLLGPLVRTVPLVVASIAMLFTLLAVPFALAGEEGIGVIGNSPFVILLVFSFLLFAPLTKLMRWHVPAMFVILSFPFAGATLLAPAYSLQAPQHLTIVHRDWDGEGEILIDATGPLPEAMRQLADFEDKPDEFDRWNAPAPPLDPDMELSVQLSELGNGNRIINIVINAPSSDRHEFGIDDGLPVKSLSINGSHPDVINERLRFIRCSGRACKNMNITIETDMKGALPSIRWYQQRYGLHDFSAPLVDVRPEEAQPRRLGDHQAIVRHIEL